jgi:hypothetical protein
MGVPFKVFHLVRDPRFATWKNAEPVTSDLPFVLPAYEPLAPHV